MQMEITIRKLQEYLKNRYKDRNDSVRLLTKLIEEVGEVAEAINISKGWKPKKDGVSLAEELWDVIHYVVALASINDIDLTEVILKKDEEASKRYKHPINLKEFIEGKPYIFPEKTK